MAAPPQQPPQYPTPAPTQEYHPDIGQTNVGGYGVNKDPYCHMVEKVVFENQCEKKTIQPLCDTQERLVCTYEPVETCNDVDKQYCHKVEKVVLEEECDMK